VEWLRIELGSELLDFVPPNLARSALKMHPDKKVFKPLDHLLEPDASLQVMLPSAKSDHNAGLLPILVYAAADASGAHAAPERRALEYPQPSQQRLLWDLAGRRVSGRYPSCRQLWLERQDP
jgi:hypothetical protein